MNIKDLYAELLTLNMAVNAFLDKTEYRKNNFLNTITFDHNDAEACLLVEELHSIFTHLDYMNAVLTYLQHPIIEEGILSYINAGTHRLNHIDLISNDVIEIFDFDEAQGTFCWRIAVLHPRSNYHGKRARIRAYKNISL